MSTWRSQKKSTSTLCPATAVKSRSQRAMPKEREYQGGEKRQVGETKRNPIILGITGGIYVSMEGDEADVVHWGNLKGRSLMGLEWRKMDTGIRKGRNLGQY